MELDPKDLRIDTFQPRPQGWILKLDICVRITHLPTGISVEKCDDRSQHRNKANAYADLCAAVEKYYESVDKPIAQTQVKLYACHDAPRPVAGDTTHFAQDGYDYAEFTASGRRQRYACVVPIKHVMTTECQRGIDGEALKDKRCTGCKHIRK